MRSLVIFLPGGVGGAERVGVTFGNILKKNDFEVHFCILGDKESTINSILPGDCERHYIANNYLRWLKINALIRKLKADVVFAPCRAVSRDLVLSTKPFGLKCKVIVRSDNPLRTMRPRARKLIRMTFRRADKVIAQQEEMQKEIVEEYPVPASKVVVIHNPIDYDLIDKQASVPTPYREEKETIRFVWVARISESKTKGHDYLLEAFDKVHEHLPMSHLYCVGAYNTNGFFFNQLRNYVDQHHLGEFVHFVGFDSNPHRWVKNADCFVLPSRVEGLPNALIEAMYLGKPVVATRCLPIIDRMVEDGKNGFRVEVGDTKAMAIAMENALLLKDIKFTYKPTQEEYIIALFEN